MNANDVLWRYQRTEITEAQETAPRIERQNELVPGVPRSETGSANPDPGKGRHRVSRGRHDQPQGKASRAIVGKPFIERSDDFVGVTLNAGHALSEKAPIDRPGSAVTAVI